MLVHTASRRVVRTATSAQSHTGRRCLNVGSVAGAHSQSEKIVPFSQLRQLLAQEKCRLESNVGLIASQNIVFPSVESVLKEIHMQSQPSEGRPGNKLYAGCEVMEQIEVLCEAEALKAFRVDSEQWDVNVQLLSCSSANVAAALGLLSEGERIVSLSTSHGGHISHGNTASSPLTRLFEPQHYGIDMSTGAVDYDDLRNLVQKYQPKLIFTGASTQTRDTDYKLIREIADISGAYLIADISHTSGLILAQEFSSPFEYCDVVTTSTYKGLRGPRSAVMFYRRELAGKVQRAVFPGLQSGPRNVLIAGMCQMFRELQTSEYTDYVKQTVRNAQRMSERLSDAGFHVLGGGTDSHQMTIHAENAVDFERKAEASGITLNRNMWPGNTNPFRPTGLRIGTNLTTVNGYKEDDYDFLADVMCRVRSSERAETIALDVQNFLAGKELALDDDEDICIG
eukprot:CAMPEP_0195297194 /NCGR_PEP_ID=MMETSP0707-20130614/21004_1 /TAXON_ID=33640 /ORGANISM="Asterionellopsis glacialis, Strain CCMP134" /LENGTH=453 /DNA_ID=CAMNT_0040358929 /DNA_START=153 /DNA_END=1514 /DNA_ORIENTATION=+